MEHEIVADLPSRPASPRSRAVPRPKSATRSPNSRPRSSTSRRSWPRPRRPDRRGAGRGGDRRAPPCPERPACRTREAEEAEVSIRPPRRRGVDDEDDAFWNEQRLSDELDQALEAPRDPRSAEPTSPSCRGGSRAGARAERGAEPEPSGARRAAPTRTCWRRPPTSSRRPPRTTSSGSSRSRPRTSTSTMSPRLARAPPA